MPESITIAGIDLKLRSFSQQLPLYRGTEGEAFDNTAHRGTDAPKRRWIGETIEYPPATETALRVLVDAGPVVCSGLVHFGESVTAMVRVENSTLGPNVQGPTPDYATVNVTLSLTIREA